MDTKSNLKNKSTGILLSILLLGLMAAGILLAYPKLGENYRQIEKNTSPVQTENTTYSEERNFIEKALAYNYGLYWRLSQTDRQILLNPNEVFLPEYLARDDFETYGSIITTFNETVEQWYQELLNSQEDTYPVYYAIVSQGTGNSAGNEPQLVHYLASGTDISQDIQNKYDVFILFRYDENGDLTVSDLYGTNAYSISDIINMDVTKAMFEEYLGPDEWAAYSMELKSPRDVTICYGVPKGAFTSGSNWYTDYYRSIVNFGQSGFWAILFIAAVLVFLIAVFLPFKKSLGIHESILSRLPLELAITCGAVALTLCGESLTKLASSTASGEMAAELAQNSPYLGRITGNILIYGINWIMLFLILLAFYLFFLSVRRLFQLKPRRYFYEMTLIGRIYSWCSRKGRKFINDVYELDFSDKTNRTLFKIAGINFIVLSIISCFWFFGIFALLIYSVAIFFIMKNYTDNLKKKYKILLKATHTMAEGNLNIDVEENLGVFEPIKEELRQVQQGFKKAVDEETKSQQMKTELITNVSHDLKTPLTAIITYVNLLKEENITEEERKSYVDTLDRKSTRLKQLIEDLFEVSKANSHNVTLHPVDVDLGSLIKQVSLELEDKIMESMIEFRYQIPDEKIILQLDSEKTFRIIENLMVNITKYAMPHSRAYIELRKEASCAIIIMKNISATELDFDNEQITERFVRGDKSRSSDGSGLGLAIVKSFTELQGGSFEIITDGDLFKAVITFCY